MEETCQHALVEKKKTDLGYDRDVNQCDKKVYKKAYIEKDV